MSKRTVRIEAILMEMANRCTTRAEAQSILAQYKTLTESI